MNDSQKSLPGDAGLQLMEPMAPSHAGAPPRKLRPQKLLFFLRKFWWIPVLTCALGFGAAVIIIFKTPPIFVSYGSLWEAERLRLPDGAAFDYDRDNFLGTLTEVLSGRPMWDRTTNYLITLKPQDIVWDKDGNIIPVTIQVFVSPKSSVYSIEAQSSNPGFTPTYLEALMDQYLDFRLSARSAVSDKTLKSISTQLEEYERDLRTAQTALSDYARSNNFAVLQQESSIDGAHLLKLKTDLADCQLEMKLLEARELQTDSDDVVATNSSDTLFDSLRSSGPASSSTSGRLDTARQLALLEADRARLSKYLRPEHPKIVKLDEDIARSQKLIEVYHQQSQDSIKTAREALQIKIKDIQQSIKDAEAKVADVNDRLARADGLKQEVQSKQRMYDRLSALSDNVDVSRNIDQDTLAIYQHATPAKRSYSRAKAMLVQLTVAGAGLGLGVIFLLAWRDDRFGSLVEVTDAFGDSVVGQVPEVPGISRGNQFALLECNDDRHMYAESYRNLRSAIRFLAIEGNPPKTLLVTSAVPDEGKSTVATNLARALALGGSKVLLVDGDLRKGHIHEFLKLESKPGLSELLRRQGEPETFIQATDLPGFAFLSRGGVTRNPGDLLLSPAFDQLLARFREQYDYVVIDSGPVFAADDTATMAPKADGALFVVRSRFSHARIVREGLELLFQRQTRVLGLILNRSDSSSRSYYFYKYADYYSAGKNGEVELDT